MYTTLQTVQKKKSIKSCCGSKMSSKFRERSLTGINIWTYSFIYLWWQMYCMLFLVIMIILWASSQGVANPYLGLPPYSKQTLAASCTCTLTKLKLQSPWFSTFFGWIPHTETSCLPPLSTLSPSYVPMVAPNPRAISNWINMIYSYSVWYCQASLLDFKH